MTLKYKLGLRAIKTAIAVFLCLLISFLLNRSDQLFSSIAAIICMQKTYGKSIEEGLHRLIGTVLGGIIGYLIILFIQLPDYQGILNVFVSPICILLVIYICNVIKKTDSVVIGCIVVLSVITPMDLSVSDKLVYVVDRVLDTSMGIIIAMLVNRFVLPNHNKKIQENRYLS